jgi:hypothetical protein
MRPSEPSPRRWTLEHLKRPWSGVSVYQQLCEPLSGESSAALVLEPLDRRCSTLSFALERLRLTRTRAALLALVERPSAEHLATLYRLSTQILMGSVDPECSEGDVAALLDDERVQAVGRVFATETPRLAAVGLGVALLSRSTAPADRRLLLDLGSTDLLGACVAEALAAQGREAVFALAQHARGKARCNAIEWLVDADEPEICGWLLREGALDAEHHHHVAYVCASTGRLHDALDDSQVDEALLTGAAALLQQLATSVSAPDIGDYAEASAAIAGFLRHTRNRQLSKELGGALEALAECPYIEPHHARACRERLESEFKSAATRGS